MGFARDQPDPGFLWPVGSVGACRCLRRRSAGLDERVREAQRNGLPYVCSRISVLAPCLERIQMLASQFTLHTPKRPPA